MAAKVYKRLVERGVPSSRASAVSLKVKARYLSKSRAGTRTGDERESADASFLRKVKRRRELPAP